MSNKIFFQPNYVKYFRCDGQKCGAQCCKRWIIDIDKKTFDNYAKIESPAKEITSHIKFFKERESYVALLDKNYSCMFLTEDNLCWIQKNHGEQFLSSVCQTFPRSIVCVEDLHERALSLTCPLAAELALLPIDPMDFEIVEGTLPSNSKVTFKICPLPKEIETHLVDIQLTAICILQERSLTLDQRLATLGFYLDRLDEIIGAKKFDVITKLNETYTSLEFIDNIVSTMLSKLTFNPAAFVKVMFGNVLEILYNKDTQIKELDALILNAVMETFKIEPASDGTISVDVAAENFLALNNLRGKFFRRFNTIFENYLANEFFLGLYPYRIKKSIRQNYGVFLATYKIIEQITFALTQKFPSTNEVDVVKIISVLSSSVDHCHPYLEKVAAKLKDKTDTVEIISTFLQT